MSGTKLDFCFVYQDYSRPMPTIWLASASYTLGTPPVAVRSKARTDCTRCQTRVSRSFTGPEMNESLSPLVRSTQLSCIPLNYQARVRYGVVKQMSDDVEFHSS